MKTIWSKISYIFFNFCEVNETVTKNVKKMDSILPQIAKFCESIYVKMVSI